MVTDYADSLLEALATRAHQPARIVLPAGYEPPPADDLRFAGFTFCVDRAVPRGKAVLQAADLRILGVVTIGEGE